MDYKEKYNEALSRAKKELDVCGSQDCDAARQIFRLFPELKSEDEKVRKNIISWLKNMESQTIPINEYNSAIAWLEKQGEQKPIDMSIKEKAHQIAWETSKHYDPLLSKESWCEMAALDMASWLETQGQQEEPQLYKTEDGEVITYSESEGYKVIKPKFKVGDSIKTTNEEPLTITKIDGKGYWSEDLLVCDFDYAAKWELVEYKPAWSEEDEKILNKIIQDYEAASKSFCGHRGKLEWLKSLKQRIGG